MPRCEHFNDPKKCPECLLGPWVLYWRNGVSEDVMGYDRKSYLQILMESTIVGADRAIIFGESISAIFYEHPDKGVFCIRAERAKS